MTPSGPRGGSLTTRETTTAVHKPSWLDDAGGVADEVVRDSYGVRVVPTTEPVAYGYTGHAEDPTGLVWGRASHLGVVQGSVRPREQQPHPGAGGPPWANVENGEAR